MAIFDVFNQIYQNRHIYRGLRTVRSFVPKHGETSANDVNELKNFLCNSGKIVALTGAGVSTESGIPDYRSEDVGLYATSDRKPMQYKDFLSSERRRQQYWSRSFSGWRSFSSAKPNISHKCLAILQHRKLVSSIVTQNVDRLHHQAGSKNITELHGTLYKVHCLSCRFTTSRNEFQELMKKLNPGLTETSGVVRPDGDVELPQSLVEQFKVPSCPNCNGILKPYVVFFGDNVPSNRVEKVRSVIHSSDALFVVGSSLHVYSAFRFILQAKNENTPISILNIGPTRGDSYATLKINAKSGDVLEKVVKLLPSQVS